MAVMQTPHGRVIGLILPKEDQPMKEAVKKEREAISPAADGAATPAPVEGAARVTAEKKAGRTAKK